MGLGLQHRVLKGRKKCPRNITKNLIIPSNYRKYKSTTLRSHLTRTANNHRTCYRSWRVSRMGNPHSLLVGPTAQCCSTMGINSQKAENRSIIGLSYNHFLLVLCPKGSTAHFPDNSLSHVHHCSSHCS